jgi:hypothetical protein
MATKLCVCGCGTALRGRQRSWATEECRKTGTKWARIEKVYGITEEQYWKIWEEQGRVCAICKRPPRVGETFHIDHEHQEGQSGPLRGIVCPYDNTRIIGRLKSHERAQALADYLRDPPAQRALGEVVWSPGRPRKKRQPRKKPRKR